MPSRSFSFLLHQPCAFIRETYLVNVRVETLSLLAISAFGTPPDGGERKEPGPGEVVHISVGIPHQLLVDAGKEFTYFVVKIHAK